MNILFFNKNFIFKKFLNFYSYKIFLTISNNNLYCYLFSFFKLNVIFSISSIDFFLKNYILLNFGSNLNYKIFGFFGKLFSTYILNLNVLNIRFLNFKLKYSKKIKNFFYFFNIYFFKN
ncbi:hypothetical protein NDNC_1010 [Candidatus Nasuia deltocephalinicola]|uniref:Uncharacterized protein n=1 Tax=Candidatus Nasuia deltocephalincola TaxID=1160784 RepID=A0A975A3A5_9PROT|nr:hypothetical protein CU086_00235 [Candidatus Nasuia deltocephalinicola]BEH03935.1 hypothetical protein NDNC_1010 [Candidatus Nasuia deltocephalinicola]